MELRDLIRSVDILDYVSQYTDFREKGGEYWALSPLKNENTPSFSIRRETQQFYDFSSGTGGDLLDFIMCFEHCSCGNAIEKLKAYAGYNGEVRQNAKLAATDVAKMFGTRREKQTNTSNRALPDDYMLQYERPKEKLSVWEREGISIESLNKYQVCYDSFSNRIVYPVRNLDGKIVNIGGRTLDEHWKEKQLRKYTYFRGWDGGLQTIYGMYENRDAIKAAREVILFEGAKSVMLADTYGVHNTAAILTSHLGTWQMKCLIKMSYSVVFALDKDVDIRADKNIQKLKRYVNVFYIWDRDNLLGEKDAPVDRGREVFMKLLEARQRYV